MRERGSETGPESRVTDPDPRVTDPQALRVPAEDLNQPDAPWGVEEDSPMDEGSEVTAVTEARRGERRAGKPPEEPPERQGMLPPVEPTRDAGGRSRPSRSGCGAAGAVSAARAGRRRGPAGSLAGRPTRPPPQSTFSMVQAPSASISMRTIPGGTSTSPVYLPISLTSRSESSPYTQITKLLRPL